MSAAAAGNAGAGSNHSGARSVVRAERKIFWSRVGNGCQHPADRAAVDDKAGRAKSRTCIPLQQDIRILRSCFSGARLGNALLGSEMCEGSTQKGQQIQAAQEGPPPVDSALKPRETPGLLSPGFT